MARVRTLGGPAAGGAVAAHTLHPALAARYESLVAPVVPTIEAALGPEVLANRVAISSDRPPRIVLAPWRAARARFRRASRDLASTGGLLFTDVVACYPSIRPDAVRIALADAGATRRRARDVTAFLERLAELGMRGLPVGPAPSAVLANAVLRRVDLALIASGRRHVRWVDDLTVAIQDERDAADALAAIDAALAQAGLRRHLGKTRVVTSIDARCFTVDPSPVAVRR
jgi:hypothetical protein